jgi:hypothetical protein
MAIPVTRSGATFDGTNARSAEVTQRSAEELRKIAVEQWKRCWSAIGGGNE